MVGESESVVLGQKYAFATASLLTGIATFINLLSLEKATLAIAFGILALRASPSPSLSGRRGFAKVGVALGALAWLAVPIVIFVFHERLAELLAALERLP